MSWFWLKVSRPGLWFQTVWLYLLPTSGQAELFSSWQLWLGLLFVTFPLNLLVYGWNDLVDADVDRLNPRKDSFLFGARGSAEDLSRVPHLIALVNLPWFLLLIAAGGWRMLLVLAGIVGANALYNAPRHGLRSRPPLELLNQLGYLLILPLSSLLNQVPMVRPAAVAYLALFCTHAHLMGEIMDVLPDREAGRRTTATRIGVRATKCIVLGLVLLEGGCLVVVFEEWLLGVFLGLGALWLLLDLTLLYGDRPYSRPDFRLFGIALNVAGFASISWVWLRGGLG